MSSTIAGTFNYNYNYWNKQNLNCWIATTFCKYFARNMYDSVFIRGLRGYKYASLLFRPTIVTYQFYHFAMYCMAEE